jgi:putative ABC transport system ATP-binding protein
MDESFITIRALHKTFVMGDSQVHALAGVDMAIPENTFWAVMGPSGSGKSTLLHLLGGLDHPTSGHIMVGGRTLETLNENDLALFRRHTVGFVFQAFNLIPTMTAVENVAFPMRFARMPRRARLARALTLLEKVGLADRAYHQPTQLSGGQQQRVAIARALANDPRVILADEPTGNLDTSSGLSIMRLLAELHHGGRTVLVVTHDQRVTGFSTHCVYLLDGQIVTEQAYNAAIQEALKEAEGNPL